MALQDYYNTGDDTFATITSAAWYAQTFTANQAYTIGSVKLRLWRQAGAPANVTVSIRATDGSGHPTGGDLTSGSIAGSGITENTAGAWYEITLTSYSLSNGVKYAIVVRVDTNNVRWRVDNSSPTYAGGNGESSGDSGASWSTRTYDCMFETYDAGNFVELSSTIAAISGMSAILTVGSIVDLSATIAAVSALSAILTVPTVFKTTNIATIKRVVVAGNDEIWFEDI